MGDYRHNPPYMEDINTHLLFTVLMFADPNQVSGVASGWELESGGWVSWRVD